MPTPQLASYPEIERDAYRAGWHACMQWDNHEPPTDLDAEGCAAWLEGYEDALDAPIGSEPGIASLMRACPSLKTSLEDADMIHLDDTLYLETYSGPLIVIPTGREMTSRQGTRYIEVTGWLPEPMYVSAERLATDPRQFERNTMRSA